MPFDLQSVAEFHVDAPDVRNFSVMPRDRLLFLYEQARLAAEVPGDVAELGVYKGGSAILLTKALPTKAMHVFESFIGLMNLSNADKIRGSASDRGHAEGDFSIADETERQDVKLRLQANGICLYEGSFSEQSQRVSSRTFCFAHFDGDTYRSAREFIEFFYPRLAPYGRLVFDDFRWPATPGVERALVEYFGPKFKLQTSSTYQAVIVKNL